MEQKIWKIITELQQGDTTKNEAVSKLLLLYNAMPSLPEWKLNNFVKIKGKTFSCQECGSNMFSKSLKGDMKYKCQGCGEMYQGQ